MRTLILGLPGSGKSTLAKHIVEHLNDQNQPAVWLNAKAVRTAYDDWDFGFEGRSRQARRMNELAFEFEQEGKIVVLDFVCPLKEFREHIHPDLMIWMDTIKTSKFADTDKIFEPAGEADYIIFDYTSYPWDLIIAEQILFMVRT